MRVIRVGNQQKSPMTVGCNYSKVHRWIQEDQRGKESN